MPITRKQKRAKNRTKFRARRSDKTERLRARYARLTYEVRALGSEPLTRAEARALAKRKIRGGRRNPRARGSTYATVKNHDDWARYVFSQGSARTSPEDAKEMRHLLRQRYVSARVAKRARAWLGR